MKLIARLLLAALLLSLAACGGGGGKSNKSNSAPLPVQDDGGSDTGDDSSGDSSLRISGTVYAERFSDTDSDGNDPQAPFKPNNEPEQAQPLGNPVVLGGFASAEGDSDDWYSVSLPEAQSIRLTIHEHKLLPPNDLDLYLYNPADTENPVESSNLGVDGKESIEVSASGDYLLRVEAVAGASGYTLQIDSSYDHRRLSSPSVGDDFIPGELIIKWKDSPGGRQMQRSGSPVSRPHRQRLAKSDGLEAARKSHPYADTRTRDRLRTLVQLKALRADPAVEYAEPNYRYHSLRIPSDLLYVNQWHYDSIHLREAWDITTGSPDTTVAVLDTGIFGDHPDFSGKLLPGYDFISDPDNARDNDGIDPDPEDEGDLARGDGSSSWHGTHVAGTVGAHTDNTEGVSGSGWETSVMPLRVLGADGGSSYDIAQAVRYAARLSNDSDELPERRAAVINMSFGGPGFSQTLQDALSAARDAGVILVAAAGNDNSDTRTYPAAMQGVIAVSATDSSDQKAPYSNFGDWVDLAAPGGDAAAGVFSTYVDEGGGEKTANYTSLQGTSMASPHAAGVFALMVAENPQLTPDDLDALLASGQLTDDLGEPGRDLVYGHGLLNAYKSVQAAGQEAIEPVIVADPETLDFTSVHTELTVDIRNIGAGGASVSDVQPGADWITGVEKEGVDGSGFGTYSVSVNRNGLADGMHKSEVAFTVSGADDFHLPVQMQVGKSISGFYAGHLYIHLLKPVDGGDYEIVQQLAKSTDRGEYPFEFSGVEPGDYAIVAGSDLNGNGTICEAGEACGFYPSDGEKSFVVDGDRENLDFTAGYSGDAD